MSQKRSAESFGSTPNAKKSRSVKSIVKSNPNPIDANGLSECFKKVKSSIYVSLAPSYINSPLAGVKSQHLDSLIMKFSEKLRGVVLGYSDVTIVNDNHDEENKDELVLAKVNAHSPFAFLWVHATFLVWRPKVGDVVEGLVYMQSPSHIGLLIHDTFNASIKKFNIPEDWTFVPNQEDENVEDEEDDQESNNNSNNRTRNNILGQWIDANEVPIDGKLKVTVKAIRIGSRVLSLEATLIKPEQEVSSLPVVPGGKKIKFDDYDDQQNVDENANDAEVPGYDNDSDSDKEVVAEDDSSEEEESDSE